MEKTFRPLTVREQNILKYHRNVLNSHNYELTPDQSILTFNGTYVPIALGDPRTQLLPQHGQTPQGKWGRLESMEEIRNNATKSGMEFPVYDNKRKALAAQDHINHIMRKDIQRYKDAYRLPMSTMLGITNGGVW